RAGGGVVGVVPAARLVPALLVPAGEAAGHAAGRRPAPAQARLVEGADAVDVAGVAAQPLGGVEAEQPGRLDHPLVGPALLRAERLVGDVAGPVHVDHGGHAVRDGPVEVIHPGGAPAAHVAQRPALGGEQAEGESVAEVEVAAAGPWVGCGLGQEHGGDV